jgi:hypothetical protein
MGVESEYYTYTLTGEELEGSRMTEPQLREMFGANILDYIIAQIGRAKAWANLVATNWPEARRLKIQDVGHILEYETQDYCHQGAVNDVIRWQRRLDRLKRALQRKAEAKKKGRTGQI